MKKIAALAFAIAATASIGETVAWWRFGDLGAGGGKATADTVFLNQVDSSRFTAYPRSFRNQELPATDSAYMPSTTNSFGAYGNLRVVDPVSGTTNSTSTALSCPWGGDGSGLSGGAVVPIEPELCGVTNGVQGDFTFECFFRTTEAGLGRSAIMEPIAGVPNSGGNMGAWSILIYEKRLRCRCTVKDLGDQISASGDTVVTPDEWHHVAIVYTVSDKIFRVYLDYSVTVTLNSFSVENCTGEIDYNKGKYLYFGKGTYLNDRSLDGAIAEARFSNAALGPQEFLRFEEEGNSDRESSDPDTAAWFSMDATGYGESFLASNKKLGVADANGMFGLVFRPGDETVAAFAQETPGTYGIVRAAVTGENSRVVFDNAASAFFGKDTETNWYFQVSDPNKVVGGGSFTAELFFRTARTIETAGNDLTRSYGIMESSALKLIIEQSSGRLFLRPTCSDGVDRGISIGTVRVDDCLWHHVALTYDADSRNLAVYLDYSCIATMEAIEFKAQSLGTALNIGCSRVSNAYQHFDGWIDEVRITARAMQPRDLLVAAPGVSSDTMLARIPLDGDAIVFPYGLIGKAEKHVTNTDSLPQYMSMGRSSFLTTGNDFSTRIRNGGACRFEGGAISFPSLPEIERSNITIEFFWRPFDKMAPWPTPLGLAVNSSQAANADNYGVWLFFYTGTWDYSQLRFRFAYMDGDVRKVAEIYASKTYSAGTEDHRDETPGWRAAKYDGRWHHVAVTIEEYTDENEQVRTKVTSYFDYEKLRETDVAGTLYLTPGRTAALVMQKASSSQNRLCNWDLDEVRITAGILDVSRFCRKVSGGAVLTFR